MARRAFLGASCFGLGQMALASLLRRDLAGAEPLPSPRGALPSLHFAPKARRVIFLFMSGGPSHVDLFDPKPRLQQAQGQDLPRSVLGNHRLPANTAGQGTLPLVGPVSGFVRCGKGRTELSDLL